MQNLLHQWHKTSTQRPALKTAIVGILCLIMMIGLMRVLPQVILGENEQRPPPNKSHLIDSFTGELVYQNGTPEKEPVIDAKPDTQSISDVFQKVLKRPETKPQTPEEGTTRIDFDIKATVTPNQYMMPVAQLESAGQGTTLNFQTGVSVDVRDLQSYDEFYNRISLVSPGKGYRDLTNFRVRIVPMRDKFTRCLYYQVNLYGQKRLIIAPDEKQEVDIRC